MRFQTLADVLEVVKTFHKALAEQFSELEQLTTSERAQLMLDYLNRHERHLSQATAQYGKDADSGLLHTWLQFAPESHPQDLVAKIRAVDMNDVDSIVAVALEVDDYLIQLYRDLLADSETDELKEGFESLIRLEDNERHTLARAAFRLSDL